jgi:hypothetical protein
MRDAEILARDNCIQTAILSPRLKGLVEGQNPSELAYFPGIPLTERNP